MAKWEDLEDFPLYAVSDEGEVMNMRTGRILRPGLSDGRPIVGLRRDGKTHMKMVSQLVAAAFIEGHEPGKNVRHVNENVADNRAENLRVLRP